MNTQNPSMPVAAWWCLVAAGTAACGATLGDAPITVSAALLLVMITLVPAAIVLVWRPAPEVSAARVFAGHRAVRRGTRT